VAPKQIIEVDRLEIAEGEVVELNKVLLISDNQHTLIGNPTIKDAKVIATSMGEVKGDKSKVRYRRKTGHRPISTRLSINEIVQPGG
jgi:large subunit ribosomal protein L21